MTRAHRLPGSPQAIVAAGYDRIADAYLAWSGLRPSPTRLRALALADAAIPAGADVLELGCGAGLPMTAHLAVGRNLTGVDISAAQLELARVNVPGATFVQADLVTLDWPDASLDAVVAFYMSTPSQSASTPPGSSSTPPGSSSTPNDARNTPPGLAEPGDRFDARFLWVLARAPGRANDSATPGPDGSG